MTCAMCNSVGCPYCRGAIPVHRLTVHSGHRHSFQDVRSVLESHTVRPADADGVPPQGGGAGQEPSASSDHRITDIVHALEATGEHLADVPELQSTPPENE